MLDLKNILVTMLSMNGMVMLLALIYYLSNHIVKKRIDSLKLRSRI